MAITKEEIEAKCSAEMIASRDCQAIADAMNVGRVRNSKREIGYGTILETIGFEAGNALSDEINTNTLFRYVKPLVEQGRLIAGSPLVAGALQVMVGSGKITQAQANALKALGVEENPCTPQEVAEALYNTDGSMK